MLSGEESWDEAREYVTGKKTWGTMRAGTFRVSSSLPLAHLGSPEVNPYALSRRRLLFRPPRSVTHPTPSSSRPSVAKARPVHSEERYLAEP